MIQGKRVLAIVPARGGSKGVPQKNVRLVGGKPLIGWTAEAAKASKYIDKLIVSSDDKQIIDVAKQYGCEAPFIRPKAFAEDDTPGIVPVLHAIEECPGYDYVVLLQPTSPLRNTKDIDAAIEQCIMSQAPACVSVCETDKSPFWMFYVEEHGKMSSVLPDGLEYRNSQRQFIRNAYVLNGAVYVGKQDWLLENKSFISEETVAYIMPKERSIDVDTEFDMKVLKIILE